MFDEDAPLTRRRRLEPLRLDTLGVDELREYITELQAEIVRTELDIAAKQGHRSAAENMFRAPRG